MAEDTFYQDEAAKQQTSRFDLDRIGYENFSYPENTRRNISPECAVTPFLYIAKQSPEGVLGFTAGGYFTVLKSISGKGVVSKRGFDSLQLHPALVPSMIGEAFVKFHKSDQRQEGEPVGKRALDHLVGTGLLRSVDKDGQRFYFPSDATLARATRPIAA